MPNNTTCPYYNEDCPKCGPMPNNITTDTWEEEFDKVRPHRATCSIWSFSLPEKGCSCGKFKIMDFIRTQISLAEKRSAERVIEEVPDSIEVGDNPLFPKHKHKVLLSTLKKTLRSRFLTNTRS